MHCRLIPLSPKCRLPGASHCGDLSTGEYLSQEMILGEDDVNKTAFEKWIFGLWHAKDRLLEHFYQDGDFVGGRTAEPAKNTSDFLVWRISPRAFVTEMFLTVTVLASLAMVPLYTMAGDRLYSFFMQRA